MNICIKFYYIIKMYFYMTAPILTQTENNTYQLQYAPLTNIN